MAKGVKCGLLRGTPFPRDVFAGEVVEWACGGGKVLDEAAVEVGKS